MCLYCYLSIVGWVYVCMICKCVCVCVCVFVCVCVCVCMCVCVCVCVWKVLCPYAVFCCFFSLFFFFCLFCFCLFFISQVQSFLTYILRCFFFSFRQVNDKDDAEIYYRKAVQLRPKVCIKWTLLGVPFAACKVKARVCYLTYFLIILCAHFPCHFMPISINSVLNLSKSERNVSVTELLFASENSMPVRQANERVSKACNHLINSPMTKPANHEPVIYQPIIYQPINHSYPSTHSPTQQSTNWFTECKV